MKTQTILSVSVIFLWIILILSTITINRIEKHLYCLDVGGIYVSETNRCWVTK